MIIDFHTHAFPDKLAPKAIPLLAESAGVTPFHNGTTSDVIRLMDECGIDKSVVLSIATKPAQEGHVNDFAISLLENPRIIPFGSVFPGSETWESELERLAEAGIKGIKLHPEYQNFDLDTEAALPIYEKCGRLGLKVQFHAGKDAAYTTPIHTGFDRINRVVSMFPETVFIAAHMGGYEVWDDIASYLDPAENLYLDTAMTQTVTKIEDKTAKYIIDKMTPSHILLGSDSPWERPCDSVSLIERLALSEEDKNAILGGNAVRLLGL